MAKKVLNVSRHAADGLLEHPVYGPVFRRILHVAEWIGSREGQAVCKRTAELLNEDDLATARKFTAALEEEYKPNEILLNCRRARAAVRENTGEIERNRLLTGRELEDMIRQIRADDKERAADYTSAINEASAEALYDRSVHEVLGDAPEKSSLFHPEFSSLLMGTYTRIGFDFTKPSNLLDYIRLSRDKVKLTAAFRRAGQSAQRRIGEKNLRNAFNRTDQAFRKCGYAPQTAAGVGFSAFIGKMEDGPFEERVIGRFLTYQEIEEEVRAILKEGLAAVEISNWEKSTLLEAGTIILMGGYRDYLPEKGMPASQESLLEHQRNLLKRYINLLFQLAEVKEDVPPALTAQPSPVTTPTRAERIAQYRAQKERAEKAQLKELLEARQSTGIPALPTPLPPTTTEPKTDLERLISTRTISQSAAESILEFYGSLVGDDVANFEKGVRELLTSQSRRLQSQGHGTIKYFPIHKMYELRISGEQNPIRAYFGISPLEGPMLISAHHKHGDAEQVQFINAAASAWKKY